MDIVAVGTAVERIGLAMMSFVVVAVAVAAAGQYYFPSFDIAKRYDVAEDGSCNALYVNTQFHVRLEVLHIGYIYSIISSSPWLALLCYKLGIAKFCGCCLVFCYTEDSKNI